MKFGEKYELLESLTTGAIETFVANDRIRGERVLVHIVDCPPAQPDQTTSEWALEWFRRLAPEPPGPILETGKYTGTQYAYVVTRAADESAVKAWVRRYELHAAETKETRTPALEKEITTPPAILEAEPKETPPPAGTMTQLFRDFDSMAQSKASAMAEPPKSPVATNSAELNMPSDSALHPAAPWEPAQVKAPQAPIEPFRPAPNVTKPAIPDLPPSFPQENAKPGEFTSFFQGPFRGDAPSEVPTFTSQPIEPARKKVGEFTALFGGQAGSSPASPEAPTNKPGGSFTGLFRDMEPAKGFNVTASPSTSVMGPPEPLASPPNLPVIPEPPVHAAPVTPMIPATPVVAPLPSPVQVPAEVPFAPRGSASPGDGATGAFSRPVSEAAPPAVEAPVGPSPYTQIISRGKLQGLEDAGHPKTAASGPAGKSDAPSLPKIPVATPPAMPAIKAPPAPKVAAPKAPKVEAPPTPVSYWPLIITLAVLFLLALILVLYFVLRH